ncbi:alpha/beta fold hydrolase [Caulobacter sp. 3R27C2-B]|uniref:alpha/beta fold hydrolase n=1 Tax=Caulobacter sp. 3R27C2-B TaxID=2502219 RepID=UPI0014856DB2|nr:alpha/beta fold hydrolase [Caulobacter sp. 3R27C2-B]
MHGMPTWSYLYRNMIPGLVAAGYRCIAADHIGFGRSDKVVDDGWYSIAKHIKAHEDLISQLDLRDVTLFCQDWGGPIGLAQAIDSPSRFRRLVIMNTWMHHPGYAYTPAIVQWNAQWKADGLFGLNVPEPLSLGWLMAMATGRIARTDLFGILQGTALPQLNAADAAVRQAYDAPFHDLGKPGHAGARRFPLSLPFDNPVGGDADAQARRFEALLGWTGPINFIWGGKDEVFTEAWGRAWAGRFQQATFDLLPDAGHFLQDTHGGEILEIVQRRAAS